MPPPLGSKALTLWLPALALMAVPLWGQTAASGTIVGRVSDQAGDPMPNVSVVVTSSVLQLQSVRAATDANGAYRVPGLPAPGLYTITFARDGFQTFVREGLVLSLGFSARVDAALAIGQVAQQVKVVASTPVVDSVSTAAGTTLPLTEIEAIPKGLGLQELFPMAAGVSLLGKPDVGDSNLASRSAVVTYGVLLQPTIDVEGINVTTNHDFDTAVYLNSSSLAEVQLSTSGNQSDVGFPGVHVVAILKSGSNAFHGSLSADYENPRFQSNNVTPALAAQGVTLTNPLKDYYDYSGDLGGRLIPNKLWFYGGFSKQLVREGQLGFVSGPDAAGCWTCADAPEANLISSLWETSLKISYQPNETTRFVGSWLHALKFLNAFPASSTVPLPASQSQHQPIDVWKGEVEKTVTPHLWVDFLGGYAGYHAQYATEPGADKPGNPSSEELTTGLFTGPYPAPTDRPENHYEAKALVGYSIGAHLIKIGIDAAWEEGGTRVLADKASGDYLLLFNQGVPAEVQIFNFPVTPINRLSSQAAFATDTWKFGRLALNFGLRWERYHAFYPTQTKPPGEFSSAATFGGQNLLTWKDVVPRAGMAWDVTGSGKTVIKGSFGIFGDTMGDLWANTFNPNAQVTSTYRWTGPCKVTAFANVSSNNSSCDISQTTLAGLTASSPAFISAVGGISELNNPRLKQDRTYEYSVRMEREIVSNVALRLGYLLHRVYNQFTSLESTSDSTADGVPILKPYAIYMVPVVLTDALTHTPVTLYTYPPEYSAPQFNELMLVNAPDNRPDTYHSFEVTLTRRYSRRWNVLTSFWITRNHEWIQAIQPSPNDARFPIDNTWNWEARGSGTYDLPWGLQLSGFYRAQSGIPGQRTETFSSPFLLQGAVACVWNHLGASEAR
ncbi:MAG TPA: carboxypeptidase-like regulatory domain-containing protein [Bryobacteraceae bacterium]